MATISDSGLSGLKRPLTDVSLSKYNVHIVRDLADYQKMTVIRAVAFMGEQSCPFEEEFDGNDLNATHLIAFAHGEPVATLRLRWFANFGKIERVCVLPTHRGSAVVRVLLAHAFELSTRKGYQTMIAQIQARLWPVWSRMLNCHLRTSRSSFFFSDFEYFEIEIPLLAHPNAVRKDADPYVMIRPEGEWDKPGILEASTNRNFTHIEAA